jgi:drug/metabolite transporter (DMT)-like permease
MLAVLATLLFSAKGIFIKMAYVYQVEPAVLMFIRMMIALPFYGFALLLQYQENRLQDMDLQSFLWIAFFGCCGYYVASYLDLTGLLYLPASVERLVLYSYPSLVLLLSVMFLGHVLSWRLIVSLMVIYAGLITVFAEDIAMINAGGAEQLYGGMLVFGAAASFAIYLIGSEIMMRTIPSALFTALAMISASIAILIHYFLNFTFVEIWGLHPMIYFYGAIIAIFCTVFPSFLLSSAVKRIGAATGSMVGSAGPVLTLIMAVIFLNEKISIYQAAGFLLVIIGVINIGRLKSNNSEVI